MQILTKTINTVRVINVVYPAATVSAVSLWFRAGSRFDPKGKEGLAHLFEHVLMEKTPRFSSFAKLSAFLETKGVRMNASIDKETAHYSCIQRPDQAVFALRTLLSAWQSSTFTDQMIEREKQTVIGELLERRDDPGESSYDASIFALWSRYTLGQCLLGSKKTVESITKADVDQFFARYYRPENMVVVIVSPEEVQVDEALNGIQADSKSRAVRIRKIEAIKPKHQRLDYGFERAQLSVVFATVGMADRKAIASLNILRDYLANIWSSVLKDALRFKKRITYDVNAYTFNVSDVGALRISLAVDKADVKMAKDVIFREVQKLREGEVKMNVFNAAKAVHATDVAAESNSVEEIMWRYGWFASLGLPLESFDEYLALADAVTENDLIRVAKKYLDPEKAAVIELI